MARLASNSRKAKSKTTEKAQNGKKDKKNTVKSESDKLEQEDKNGHEENQSGLLSECKKWFSGASDLYHVLGLDRTASFSQIKKAYYQLSLRLHPDKVDQEAREESTFKFQVLGRVYSILGDEEKRKVYDETGCIDGEDENGLFSSDIKDWEGYWRTLFKRVSKQDVDEFFKSYRNSDEERADLLAAYEKFSGDMDLILECVIGVNAFEDEPRFKQIIDEAIESQEVKAYAKYTKESKTKATKRQKMYEKEAEEAAELQKELGVDLKTDDDLVQALQARGKARAGGENFLAQLEKKYAAMEEKKPKRGATAKKAVVESEEEENDSEDSEFEEAQSAKKKAKAGNGRAATTKRVKRL